MTLKGLLGTYSMPDTLRLWLHLSLLISSELSTVIPLFQIGNRIRKFNLAQFREQGSFSSGWTQVCVTPEVLYLIESSQTCEVVSIVCILQVWKTCK